MPPLETGIVAKADPENDCTGRRKRVGTGSVRILELPHSFTVLNAEFDRVFPGLVVDVVSHPDHGDMPHMNEWLTKVMAFNVPDGKRLRGLMTAMAYDKFRMEKAPAPQDIHKSYVLGWCIEMLQAALLISTDLMDEIGTRRGKPAWHLHDNLGSLAFNDAILISGAMYYTLQRTFQEESYYSSILNAFHEAQMMRAIGETLEKKTDLQAGVRYLSMANYEALVKCKTAHFSFVTPVKVAMLMAGVASEVMFQQVEELLLKIGYVYHVIQDYNDLYGEDGLRVGISSGAHTWFIYAAIQRANRHQQSLIAKHYGQPGEGTEGKDPDGVDGSSLIHGIYEDMALQQACTRLIHDLHDDISSDIHNMSTQVPNQFFKEMVQLVYSTFPAMS